MSTILKNFLQESYLDNNRNIGEIIDHIRNDQNKQSHCLEKER